MSAWRELDLAHAEDLTAPGSAQLHLAIRWPESQKFLSIKKALEIGGPERAPPTSSDQWLTGSNARELSHEVSQDFSAVSHRNVRFRGKNGLDAYLRSLPLLTHCGQSPLISNLGP